ncbi:MAG: recombinase family protein [Synergistaceae bacterium]|jgi:hypothetical protein|nr:recombinase family protein [Synergistaceae bacterium]
MARKKDVDTPKTILLEIPAGSDLPLRIEKISEQTGLPPLDLFQKWVFHEESLIGLLRRSEDQTTEGAETRPDAPSRRGSNAQGREQAAKIDPDSPKYRKAVIKRIQKLKKEGTPLIKIAKIFNEENLPTMSGKGKWYSSSITWLLGSDM